MGLLYAWRNILEVSAQELLAVRMFLSAAAADRISSTPVSASSILTLSHDSLLEGTERGTAGTTFTAPLAAQSSLSPSSSRWEGDAAGEMQWGSGGVVDGTLASPNYAYGNASLLAQENAVGPGGTFPYGRKRTYNTPVAPSKTS